MSSSPTAFPHHYLFVTWTAKVRRNTVVPEHPITRDPITQWLWDGNVRNKNGIVTRRIDTRGPPSSTYLSYLSHFA